MSEASENAVSMAFRVVASHHAWFADLLLGRKLVGGPACRYMGLTVSSTNLCCSLPISHVNQLVAHLSLPAVGMTTNRSHDVLDDHHEDEIRSPRS